MIRMLKLWCFTIAEIVTLSIALIIAVYFFFGDLNSTVWIFTLPIYSLLGLILRKLLAKSKLFQILVGIPLCILGTYFTIQLLQLDEVYTIGGMILGILASSALFLRSRLFWEHDWSDLMPAHIPFYLMIINFFILFLVSYAPVFKPILPYTSAFGPVIIFVNLLTMNALNIRTVAEVGEKNTIKNKVAVSKGIGNQSRGMLVVAFLLILIVSTWSFLLDGLEWIAGKVFGAIWKFIFFLSSFVTSTKSNETETTPSGAGALAPVEKAMDPFWQKVIEITIIVIAILGILAIVIFLSIKIYQIIKRLIPIVKAWLARFHIFDNTMDEYTDKKERLIDLKDLPKNYMQKASEWLAERMQREAKWQEMTTVEEKVRFLYRYAVLKGISKGTLFNAAKTPTETVDGLTPKITTEEAGALLKTYYNNTRYGGKLPTEEEVNALYQKLSA